MISIKDKLPPKDGTRFIANCAVYQTYCIHTKKYLQGYVIRECWYNKNRFELWCGNIRTQSTDTPYITEWELRPTTIKGN